MTKLRKLVLPITLLVLVAVGAVGYRMATDRDGLRIEALFDATIGLYPGSDVQILGVPVGRVTAVEPEGEVVRVSMELQDGLDVAADTAAVLVAPTVVSDRFIQLTKPWDGGPKLASGAEIPVDRTAVPVEIDDLYASLNDSGQKLGPNGVNRNGALSAMLETAAKNLEGNGEGINTLIAEFGKATATLAETDEAFFETIANLEGFNDMLVDNDRGVAEVNRRFAAVTAYLAEDRQDLAAAMDNLGGALVILDDFIRDNRGALKDSVDQLIAPTKVLKKQQKSLEESVRLIPLVLQNFLNAYNPATKTVDGRGNLNELTVWSTDGLTGRTSKKAPPTMLPGEGETP